MHALTQGWTPAGLILVGVFIGVLVMGAAMLGIDILIERQRKR